MPGVSRRGRANSLDLSPNGDASLAAPNDEMPGNTRRGRQTKYHMVADGPLSPAASLSQIGGNADDEAGHKRFAPHEDDASLVAQIRSADLANLIAELREQWRRRQAWHRAEKALTLQAKALCRRLAEGGDKKEADTIYRAALGKGSHPMEDIALAAMMPLTEARDGIERHRKTVEKRLVVLAKGLPVAPWVEATRGVGLLSLAAIVGEAGDLASYGNPAKLWKRMGLAVMPDGGRQRRVGGVEALDHGYSPARRSVVWNIGACIVKAGGPLKAIYDARKVYEAERVETRAHAHNRAQRYVEKRFLRDLWSQWRKGEGGHLMDGTQMAGAALTH